jgi:hypothetical protein
VPLTEGTALHGCRLPTLMVEKRVIVGDRQGIVGGHRFILRLLIDSGQE